MSRRPSRLIPALIAAAGIVLWLLFGCALLRDGNPVTTPKTGPGTDYPCGVHGMKCPDAHVAGETCCSYGVCARDDEGPYCDYTIPTDPADPAQWGARSHARLERGAPP